MQLDTISIPSLVHTVFACCKLTTSSLDQRVLHRSKTTIYFVSSILQSPSEDRNLPISVWRMSEVFDPRLDLDPHDRTCRILDPRVFKIIPLLFLIDHALETHLSIDCKLTLLLDLSRSPDSIGIRSHLHELAPFPSCMTSNSKDQAPHSSQYCWFGCRIAHTVQSAYLDPYRLSPLDHRHSIRDLIYTSCTQA